ncbi:Serine/threonine-protein kinase pdik1l, partial [Perkinsus olseni]
LFDYVVDNENFNNENVIRFVFCQVVDALLYLHVNGVIHRDLKPENILVSSMATSCPSGYEEVPGDMPSYPIVKLADFGLSKAVQNASSLAMTWVGTPQYWAPEVIKAQEDKVGYDGRADNWSLGVLLYVML